MASHLQICIEIAQWQISGTKVIISGKINGVLLEVKIFGRSTKVDRFENVVFENIEVDIFNEQADMQQMMKAIGVGLLKNRTLALLNNSF